MSKFKLGFDYVLELFEARNLKANYFTEVRELHVALGLVAAGEGLTIVPKTLEHLCSQEVTFHLKIVI